MAEEAIFVGYRPGNTFGSAPTIAYSAMMAYAKLSWSHENVSADGEARKLRFRLVDR